MQTSRVRCVRCRYDLQGLPSDEKCPECGLETALSVDGGAREWLDPIYTARIRRGIFLILASQIAWFASMYMMGDVGLVIPIPVGIAAIGAIMLTCHPYRATDFWDHAVRWTAIVTFAVSTCISAAVTFHEHLPVLPIVFTLCWCCCIFATFQKVRILAERNMADGLSIQANLASFGLPMGMVGFPAFILTMAFLANMNYTGATFLQWTVSGGTVLFLIYVFSLVVLVRLILHLPKTRAAT